MNRVIIICILFCISCSDQQQRNTCLTVDFVNSPQRPIYMDELFDQIEIVPLETTTDCLLMGEPSILALTDSSVVLANQTRDAFLFNRKDGRFIHEVGKRGNGPNEYFYLVFDACFNQRKGVIYANRGNKWIGIDIEDNQTKDWISKPQLEGRQGTLSVINPYGLNDSLYIGYVNNVTGQEDLKLVVFDQAGKVVKHYSNELKYQVDRKDLMVAFSPGYFYKYDTELCFYGGVYKDTIYTVREDKLSAKYAINLNETSPYEVYGTSEYDSKRFNYLSRMMEYPSYLLFSYFSKGSMDLGVGYYDKKQQRTVRSMEKDGGFLFRQEIVPPFFFRYMDESGYVAGYWTAQEWNEFVEKQTRLDSVPENLKNVKIDDNPIMVIAHVKNSRGL